MTVDQLKCFVILSETLNFSHTAEIIHLTQPAITHQIKKLESLLKFDLFVRGNQKVELTAEGKILYPEVKEFLNRLQVAIDKASVIKSGFIDVINIGYEGHDLEFYNLPLIINSFKIKRPNVRINVYKSNHKERRISLLNRKYDLILTAKDNIETQDGIIYKEIMSAGLDCVISDKHPLSTKSLIKVSDLNNENIILFDQLQGPKEFNLIQDKILTLFPDKRFIYSDSEFSAAIMIKCNEGVAIMPSFCRQLSHNLRQIPFTIDEHISYGVAYLKDTPKKDVKEFAMTLKNEFINMIAPE